mmetsp:Transcript_12840/g.35965  ORF Transcript_12840/g.35965 Transcript_12840/m.35965 type:complete len:213 (+) Transcript_12840:398-1036(+)
MLEVIAGHKVDFGAHPIQLCVRPPLVKSRFRDLTGIHLRESPVQSELDGVAANSTEPVQNRQVGSEIGPPLRVLQHHFDYLACLVLCQLLGRHGVPCRRVHLDSMIKHRKQVVALAPVPQGAFRDGNQPVVQSLALTCFHVRSVLRCQRVVRFHLPKRADVSFVRQSPLRLVRFVAKVVMALVVGIQAQEPQFDHSAALAATVIIATLFRGT